MRSVNTKHSVYLCVATFFESLRKINCSFDECILHNLLGFLRRAKNQLELSVELSESSFSQKTEKICPQDLKLVWRDSELVPTYSIEARSRSMTRRQFKNYTYLFKYESIILCIKSVTSIPIVKVVSLELRHVPLKHVNFGIGLEDAEENPNFQNVLWDGELVLRDVGMLPFQVSLELN
jgi:hypothetical protein